MNNKYQNWERKHFPPHPETATDYWSDLWHHDRRCQACLDWSQKLGRKVIDLPFSLHCQKRKILLAQSLYLSGMAPAQIPDFELIEKWANDYENQD